MTLQKGTTMTTNTPSVSGGTITSWEINATLPAGLNFGTTNGSIWGTPTVLQTTATTYTIWANNTGGSSSATINITVVDEVPTLSYSPSTLVLTKGNQSSDLPLNATLTGSGTITSWEINATLPAGLNFGTTNGTIWGIPTVLQTTATTYTIWANNSGGSSSFTITLTINDEAPGPFEYNPENNTWTNNTEVHLAPQFINGTTGNGSTWQVDDIATSALSPNSNPGWLMSVLVGDTIYFSAYVSPSSTGTELWAYNTINGTTWQVADINSGSGGSQPGYFSNILVGDTLYFSAHDGSTGHELWAHNTTNDTTWQVADINTGSGDSIPGEKMMHVINGVLYFDAGDGGNMGGLFKELWAYNTSNGTTWQVADIRSGSGSGPGWYLDMVVGDVQFGVFYFNAVGDDNAGTELWAYNTSNGSDPWTWLPTSTLVLEAATLESTCNCLLGIPSISQPMTVAQGTRCGRTTHPITQLGESQTSAVVLVPSIQVHTWRWFLRKPSISPPMMAQGTICGRTTP